VRFTEFREDFNHQHQNVRSENGIEYGPAEVCRLRVCAHVTQLNAATLASLASAPALRKREMQTKNLENDTS